MINAVEQGRNLHLSVEGIESPFVIRPLPGRVGMQITNTYIEGATGLATAEQIEDALRIAVDGGVLEGGVYVPLPVDEQINYNRILDELRTTEGESVLLPAFFWQTVLGMAGVNAYIDGGEGVAGGVKALWALVSRLGLSPTKTSPSSALENLIRLQESIRHTSTHPAGEKPGKQPQDRRPKQKKQ